MPLYDGGERMDMREEEWSRCVRRNYYIHVHCFSILAIAPALLILQF